jgi:hypothetical protein
MERTVDMKENERQQAIKWLLAELEKGEKSGREKGWYTLDEVMKNLGIEDED